MAMSAAKALGIDVDGVTTDAFFEKKPIIVLDCLWHIIQQWVHSSIKKIPEIINLAAQEDGNLLKLSPQEMVKQWMNYHLLKAGQRTQIKNLGSDLSDSIALLYVLNEIDNTKCPLEDTFR